ncbi:MAG: glycosyltransferase family 9 protein [Syntrophaceae bacterium]|nr:glycosyltransferase family 9 protein [Syntrophaceae bacterium]
MLIKGSLPFGRPISSVLVVQLGDIGDVVSATPAFRAVRERFPEALLAVLVREGFGGLLEDDPGIDRVFEVRRKQGMLADRVLEPLRLIGRLRRQRFDLVIDLRGDDRGVYMSLASGAPVRAAMRYGHMPWRDAFYTHLVIAPPPEKRIRGAAHQSLDVVRPLGMDTPDPVPRLHISADALQRVRRLLAEQGAGARAQVTINPFARWKYKEWEYEKWAEVIRWVGKERGYVPVLVGSREERHDAAGIALEAGGGVINLAGETSLKELAALLSLSAFHAGVDSAAPHIAAAVGTPTITIYGPTDWRDWAPEGGRHRVIRPDRDCVPCRDKGCRGEGRSECLEELGADRVIGEIDAFIRTSGPGAKEGPGR